MGTLGIESISRGAKEVKFIEKRYRIAQLIEKNIEKLGIEENSVVIKSDVINFLNFDKDKYDIVFADPPYGKFSFEEIFPSVISLVKDGGIFCYESNKQNIDDNIPVKIKYFGNTQIVIWEKKMKKIAIYPGTFDPITNGHLDIINRSSNLFDELIIAVTNESKKESFFSINERIEMISKVTKEITNVKVDQFNGLLINYAKLKNASAIVRGIRVLSDFEYEFKMAMMNNSLNKQIDTVFLMPNIKYVHISSSLIKEVSSLDGDISKYVPRFVQDKINIKNEQK